MVRSIQLLGICLLIVSLNSFGQDRYPIIFKVKEEHRLKCQKGAVQIPSMQKLFNQSNLKVVKLFPTHTPLKQKKLNEGWVDISTIYKTEASSINEREELIRRLKKDPHIAYAEAEAINQLCYIPNDTLRSIQWYLDEVRAYEAWDIEQGDTSVFISIIDTGTDISHEDLKENVYKNYNDPINGIDDDADGYIDNFYGWDLVNNSNDVNPIFGQHYASHHGTNVAGIAAASTDNTTGISGCGFNTRMMTIKADNSAANVIAGYSGIVYSADRGARIINCSWGSYTYTRFGEDIVNYATINRGSLIICGAGNGDAQGNGVENRFYPAAYDNAIAVGALDTGGIVKRSSNHGYWLDLLAPGERMWTTTIDGSVDGTYGRNGATSMASPVVAAAAALIASQKPNYSNRQIQERLLNSGINIYSANDARYAGKLGAGRVDFLNAVADTNKPGIRLEKIDFSNGQNDIIKSGDSLFISGEFVNYLANASSGTASLVELKGTAQIVNNQINLPALNSLDRHSIDQDPFIFIINQQAASNETIEFKLTITAGTYEKIQHFSLLVNNNYLTLENDQLALTLTSSGGIGYTDPSSRLGVGFSYKGGESQLWEASFMIGNSSTYVADAFRGSSGTDADFTEINFMREFPDNRAEVAASARFNDAALSGTAQLEIVQNNYLYDSTYSDKLVIFNYVVKNISNSVMSNLHAGTIADWDIINYANNQVFYDSSYKMGVSFSTDSSLYIGMIPLSHPHLSLHYAIDNVGGGEGGVDPTSGFTTAEKYQVLSSRRDSAGFHNSSGEDIIDVISIGPFNLSPDSLISLSFAWLVADNLNELREIADSAKAIYSKLPIGFKEHSKEYSVYLYPNPATDYLNISIKSEINKPVTVLIYDLNGRLMIEKNLQNMSSGDTTHMLHVSSLKSGVYFLKLIGEEINFQDKFVLRPNN